MYRQEMYRQEHHAPQSTLNVSDPKDSGEIHRGPKNLPSGSQLPSCWNESMDHALCHMEAQDELEPRAMARLLKRRFPELEGYVIPMDAIQRRIDTLELQDNAYFKSGMEAAVAAVEAKGFKLPPYDPLNYPSKAITWKSELEVLGSGAPMTGALGYRAGNILESEAAPGGIAKASVGDRSRKTPARQLSSRTEEPSVRQGQPASESVNQNNLTDVTNTYNNPKPSAMPPASNIPNTGDKSTSTNLPATPVNSQASHHFPTPSSKDKSRDKGLVGNSHGNQSISTPSGKDRRRIGYETNASPGSFHRSGKDSNAAGMSTTTANLSILGREIPGMSAALERRHARVDRRSTPDD